MVIIKEITIYTTIYNNYAIFLKKWVEMLNKQTAECKKLVVFGKNSGIKETDKELLRKNNIKYIIEENADNMGQLRNIAINNIDTEFYMHFAVDDLLHSNAVEEILKADADVYSISFKVIEIDKTVRRMQYSPFFRCIADLRGWQKMWGGYVAVRRSNIRYREDVEVPNILYNLEHFRANCNYIRSKEELATHIRRADSHHYRSIAIRSAQVETIQKEVYKAIQDKINNSTRVLVRANISYIDKVLNKEIEKGDMYGISTERALYLGNIVEIVDIMEAKK